MFNESTQYKDKVLENIWDDLWVLKVLYEA